MTCLHPKGDRYMRANPLLEFRLTYYETEKIRRFN